VRVSVLKVSADGSILWANKVFNDEIGCNMGETAGERNFISLIGGVGGISMQSFIDGLRSGVRAVFPVESKSGDTLYMDWKGTVKTDSAGRVKLYILAGSDVTNEKNASLRCGRAAAEKEALSIELNEIRGKRWRDDSGGPPDAPAKRDETAAAADGGDAFGLWHYYLNTKTFYLSAECAEVLGFEAGEKGLYVSESSFVENAASAFHEIIGYLEKIRNRQITNFALTVVDEDAGQWVGIYAMADIEEPWRPGEPTRAIGFLKNLSEYKGYDAKIKKLAYFDPLTGIPNMLHMEEKARKIFEERPDANHALILIDVDDLKFINDTFGHSFGDELIKAIAYRMSEYCKNEDYCRFSGDELAVLVRGYSDRRWLTEYVKALLAALNIQYTERGVNYRMTVSMGVAMCPAHGDSLEELLKCADIALHRAKADGKRCFVFFDETMSSQFEDKIMLENDLRIAVDGGREMRLFFQPQYSLSTGELCGYEALARWFSPGRGLVMPLDFIPVAEETRLIIPLGKWILSESCRVLRGLELRGHADLTISVNLSTIQLMDDDLIGYVKETLRKSGVNPENLELEITETVLMENFDAYSGKLQELRDLGISIALDDFGKGYSSLTYLKRIPMDTLKIDKSFIDNITNSEIDRQIAHEIISLSHVLKFNTIAEGVESREQLGHLKKLNCDIMQGYFGGKPVPEDEIYGFIGRKVI
ncbi:MAG: bifunctional diguanylate cyclase/phosphodiesterase, partial [Defluviitaleaceae bacterium]|nr:bifunctional diguanylate cyclase/phosphodiesterase [Defluviitaleaceae bacterium]